MISATGRQDNAHISLPCWILKKSFFQPPRRQHFKSFQIIYSDWTENSCVISPRSCRGLYNFAVYNLFGRRHLGAFLASETSPRSRRVFGRLDALLAEISPGIPRRVYDRWDSHLAEISSLISPCFWPPRFSSHRDLATNLGAFLAAESFISPRSRQ